MPPSEGQEPRALIVAAQAIDGRKCAETAKVHPDLRIVYNLAYGVLADEAGRFSLVGDYTTTHYTAPFKTNRSRLVFCLGRSNRHHTLLDRRYWRGVLPVTLRIMRRSAVASR